VSACPSREQRSQLVALERPELEGDRGPRASDAVGEPAHALGRRELVRTIGGEHQHASAVDVVGEEDNEVERRRVRPVQVFEHKQDRRVGCAVGQQRERLLEHVPLRARRPVELPRLAERAQRLDERLVRQLRADEVDRASEQDLEPRLARTSSQLRRKPGLADSRFPRHEDGPAAPGVRRLERALEFPELAYASDEYLALASLHSGQYGRGHPRLGGRL
jgi:hypothetical protein